MVEKTEQYSIQPSNYSKVQYKVPISHPRQIWDMKFEDCLKRLDNEDSRLYEDIETMKDEAEFHLAEPSPEMRYKRGVVETVNKFESALEEAEDMFDYDLRFYDFSHHSETEGLSNDQEDFWWVIHHLQTMKSKAEYEI